ncbi:MAG TPA: CvpA family protein [Alcanivoracaceae bacterium]|nr:CvpA family protein [Alcanivoracaceae bacterium]
MSMADVIILAVIAISAFMSLWRGFVREAISLISWAAAFIVARTFSPLVDNYLVGTIEMPSLRLATAFVLLFVLTLVVGAIIGKIIRAFIQATGLTSTDRVLGMVFGGLRGVLIVSVLVILFRPMLEEDAWWQESSLLPYFVELEGWTRETGSDVLKFIWGYEPEVIQLEESELRQHNTIEKALDSINTEDTKQTTQPKQDH